MASPNNTGQASEPVIDRLKLLYPMVNEEETPLPRCWSPKDKYNYIGLSQNNLRVHYKGALNRQSMRDFYFFDPSAKLIIFEFKIKARFF